MADPTLKIKAETETVWLRVPPPDEVCNVTGLKGAEIRRLKPHRNKRFLRMGGCPMVTFKEVKLDPKKEVVELVNHSELLDFIDKGGFQISLPNRFNRFFRIYPYRHRKTVSDAVYKILAGPYSTGEEEALDAALQSIGAKEGIELAYTRKSVLIIQRRINILTKNEEKPRPKGKPRTYEANEIVVYKDTPLTFRELRNNHAPELSVGTLRDRIKAGWDIEKALNAEVKGVPTYEYRGCFLTMKELYNKASIGITRSMMKSRLSSGWDVELAIKKEPYSRLSQEEKVRVNQRRRS